MALHKGLTRGGFKLPVCEKHFHDHDETWVILKGRGTGYWIDPGGRREEFQLEEGDAWMIPAGYEHGSEGFRDTGKNSASSRAASSAGLRSPTVTSSKQEEDARRSAPRTRSTRRASRQATRAPLPQPLIVLQKICIANMLISSSTIRKSMASLFLKFFCPKIRLTG